MKKILLPLLILLLFTSAFSQTIEIKGRVVDSVTGKAIQYVNCFYLHTVSYTDKDGSFKFTTPSFSPLDTVIITAMGYKALKSILTSENNLIKLNPQDTAVSKTVGALNSSKKEIKVNDFKRTQFYQTAGGTALICYGAIGVKYGEIYTVYLPYESKYEKCNSVKNAKILINDFDVNCTYRLRIFEVDSTERPGIDLLRENVLITNVKGNRIIEIDLKKYKVPYSKKGLFAGVEIVDCSMKHVRINCLSQEPRIFNYPGCVYKSGKWFYIKNYRLPVSLTLTE